MSHLVIGESARRSAHAVCVRSSPDPRGRRYRSGIFGLYPHEGHGHLAGGRGGARAPQVYVSLMEGAKSHMAETCSVVGVFRPDNHASSPGKANHFFPGFTIKLLEEHHFTN